MMQWCGQYDHQKLQLLDNKENTTVKSASIKNT